MKETLEGLTLEDFKRIPHAMMEFELAQVAKTNPDLYRDIRKKSHDNLYYETYCDILGINYATFENAIRMDYAFLLEHQGRFNIVDVFLKA